MEQLLFAGKAYLKITSLVKTPLHECMAVERSGLWAPDLVERPEEAEFPTFFVKAWSALCFCLFDSFLLCLQYQTF